MPGADYIALFTRPLEAAGLSYMVTGATAAIVYGKPRYTNDVDIVIVLSDVDATKLHAAFPENQYYAPPVEVIRTEAGRKRRGHFNLIHEESGYKADLYPVGSDPLHHWAMERRRQTELPGGSVWVAPPEYVILRKLEYFREGTSTKHLTDIRAMLDVSADAIDHAVLADWIARLGLQAEWERVG
ncbi:MAG: nucleotidyl transferase AbiEii/AbiGii toxin family protein [Opitutaceae bacterium]|nr:nucleotidyl transferase AbiEii/AbiGii toxin family protein [Opitutaceae bacterium]MBP9911889.1 nucleotidyl transferase AbiEii/AbiGii toxin family protein [Opitutaceae bacterium]